MKKLALIVGCLALVGCDLPSLGCALSDTLLWAKRRCGFEDLDTRITVTGEVIYIQESADGDVTVDLVLVKEDEWALYYKGRRTREFLHVEYMPCELEFPDLAKRLSEVNAAWGTGSRVQVWVSGKWAYDGIDHGSWWDTTKQCVPIVGPENEETGWTEIHPAESIGLLGIIEEAEL